jgi:hypothetical protein
VYYSVEEKNLSTNQAQAVSFLIDDYIRAANSCNNVQE